MIRDYFVIFYERIHSSFVVVELMLIVLKLF